MKRDVKPPRTGNRRDESPRFVQVVMSGLGVLGGLGGLGGGLLVFGAIAMLMHPVGIVVLAIGILLLICTAVCGVATWPFWRSARPRWLRILAGVLIGLPLVISAAATVGTVSWLAIAGWPTSKRP